jgi:hypothetical protein
MALESKAWDWFSWAMILWIWIGGLDSIENIQPLCHGKGSCNLFKHAKTIDYLIS